MRSFFRVVFICLVSCLVIPLQAQQQRRDSLWRIYSSKEQADTNRLNAIQTLAKSYLDSNADSAIFYSEKQVLLAQETKQDKYTANAFTYIGYTYYNQDNTTKALEYFLKALALYNVLGAKDRISKCYTFIGLIYFKQSNFPQTLNYYFKSLRIEEEANNKKGMSMSYNNIGLVYDQQSDFSKALEYYSKSLGISSEMNDSLGIANSLLNSGAVYDKQLQKEKALANYLKALKIYEAKQSAHDISLCYICIGIIYYERSEFPLALDYYTMALKINEDLENKKEMSTCYLNLGNLYNKTKQYKMAESNFEKAKTISQETNDLDNLRLSYEGLSRVYKNTGDFKNAYENHVAFKNITDSIFNEENSKQLSDIKTNFEVGKIESELRAKAEAQEMISFEEKKRQQFIIYSVIVMLIVVSFFSVVLYRRYRLTNKQKEIIELKNRETELQKAIIEEHQKDTIDSINYAKRIQYALLANKELLARHVPNNFVLFHPKDIVSGDFYWAAEHDNTFYLAVGDSTGHGVPGAFMSLLNIGFLNEAVKEKNISQPHNILNFVRDRLITTIGNDGQQDGMDVILISIESSKNSRDASLKINYSAANNAAVLVRNNELIELSKNKMPVGKSEKLESFTLHTVSLQKDDNLYLYTDGYGDQFGGPKGKKFKNKQLHDLLLSCSALSTNEQKEIITARFGDWKGELEQVDDVCLIGIKI